VKCDIVIAGVGGQGALSLAALVAAAAQRAGLTALQSEIHGMSQRGGAVVAHLRLADGPIHACTVGRGRADLLLALEPLEALRHLDYLAPDGLLLTASEPLANIPDYPPLEEIHGRLRRIEGCLLIDAARLAKRAGSARAANTVLIGAALARLPLAARDVEAVLRENFGSRGDKLLRANLRAFELGQLALSGQPA
jgi:indolepyruvate ferredoxin oxidoreductase beta subunit